MLSLASACMHEVLLHFMSYPHKVGATELKIMQCIITGHWTSFSFTNELPLHTLHVFNVCKSYKKV